jgi:hypothetical protein
MGRPACKGRIAALPGLRGSPFFDAPVSASSVRLNALLEACRTLLLTNGYCWCLPLSYAIVRLSVAVTLRRQFLQMVLTGSGGVEQT